MIPLKQWVVEESRRRGVCRGTVYHDLAAGRYPDLIRQEVNQRVIYVIGTADYVPASKRPRKVRMTGRQLLKLQINRIMASPGFQRWLSEQEPTGTTQG